MDISSLPAFKVVVSDKSANKLGDGSTSKKTNRCVYYYAEKQEQGNIFIQALNGQFLPAGRKTYLDDTEFCERFRPEPLIFYNRVQPAMAGLDKTLDKADKHREAERYDKARDEYKKVLEMDQDNLRAIFGLGITYMGMGDTESAADIFAKLMSLDFPFTKENKHMFNEFGIRLRKCGMLHEALAWYDKALQCSQQDSHLYYNKGRIHYELGELDQSLEAMRQALMLEPDLEPASKMVQHIGKKTGAAAEAAETQNIAA